MRLIDADALIQDLKEHKIPFNADINEAIIVAPTIDAVPVVRCKDCKYYNAGFECLKEGYGIEYPQDWFCADGERKDGAE